MVPSRGALAGGTFRPQMGRGFPAVCPLHRGFSSLTSMQVSIGSRGKPQLFKPKDLKLA